MWTWIFGAFVDAEDFEPAAFEAKALPGGGDKWEGEDEDDDVKVGRPCASCAHIVT